MSAGGTREPIDPVRYLGNRSSGLFGVHIARQLAARGATVTLVAANVESSVISLAGEARVVRVSTTEELAEEMTAGSRDADVVIMAAAVADYRPTNRSESKLKKHGSDGLILELTPNPDILAYLATHRPTHHQTVIGFAAETGDHAVSVLEYGRQKAAAKGADLIVVNEVGTTRGFGDISTAVSIIDAHGITFAEGSGTKEQMASLVLDTILDWRSTHIAHEAAEQ